MDALLEQGRPPLNQRLPKKTSPFFAIRMGWRYRSQLRAVQLNPNFQVPTCLSLNLQHLKDTGIRALAIDFDGVLAAYGEDTLLPAIEGWLNRCIALWGSDFIFILSNRPTATRKSYFLNRFEGVTFIEHVQKKPHPEGIHHILLRTQLPATAVLVIDDRLLTGILAALTVGAPVQWVTAPFITFKTRPFSELFFVILRFLEKHLLRLLS